MQSSNLGQNIIKTGLVPGINNVYRQYSCLICRKEVGDGIYFSPSFQLAFSQYAGHSQLSTITIDKMFQNQFKLIKDSPYKESTICSLSTTTQQIKSQIIRQKYSMIFMNRLNPDRIHIFDRASKEKRKQVNEYNKHLYWVVNKAQQCRTYAVVLIKHSKLKGYPNMIKQFGQTFRYDNYRRHISYWINGRKYIPHPSDTNSNNKPTIKSKQDNQCSIY